MRTFLGSHFSLFSIIYSLISAWRTETYLPMEGEEVNGGKSEEHTIPAPNHEFDYDMEPSVYRSFLSQIAVKVDSISIRPVLERPSHLNFVIIKSLVILISRYCSSEQILSWPILGFLKVNDCANLYSVLYFMFCMMCIAGRYFSRKVILYLLYDPALIFHSTSFGPLYCRMLFLTNVHLK